MNRNHELNRSHRVAHMSPYYDLQGHLNEPLFNKCYSPGRMACILKNFLSSGPYQQILLDKCIRLLIQST